VTAVRARREVGEIGREIDADDRDAAGGERARLAHERRHDARRVRDQEDERARRRLRTEEHDGTEPTRLDSIGRRRRARRGEEQCEGERCGAHGAGI
jgi:hypothetical protein